MLTRSLLLCDCSPVIASVGDSLLNYVQVRFRRRTMVPPPWVQPAKEKIYHALRKEDRELLEDMLRGEREPVRLPAVVSCMRTSSDKPDTSNCKYDFDHSKRIGLIGRKIGMVPQWLNNGQRVLCTMIHFPENHVIQLQDPNLWFIRNPTGKRRAFGVYGPRWNVIVGANNVDSVFYTDAYRRLFQRANVPIKEFLAGFVASEDALVDVGTRLDVRHFQIGQHVAVSGKTIDWGFQGVMHRWGMKGQPNLHTTKSHRRVGSIGSKGDARVWRGRRLPGHMGYEWKHAPSQQILRINPIKQVIYVKGSVPGDVGEVLLVKDTMAEENRVKDPPFPTYVPTTEELAELNDPRFQEIHMVTTRDIYVPSLFCFNQPSVVYTEKDETKLSARDKSRAKLAKVKKH